MASASLAFVGFSLLPAVALILGAVYSVYEIRRLGDRRLGIVVFILALMSVHQFQEILYYIATGAFRDPIIGELPETAVNLLSAGGVYYLLTFARRQHDLRSELEASETELLDLKRRLERIFDNVNDGILLIDMEREAIIEANQPAHTLLRYDVGDLVGRSPYDIHPHEPEQFELFTDSVRTDGGAMTEQLRCRRGDGTTMPAAVSAAQTTLDGTEMLLVTIRDNSEREQYRSQLELLARVLRHNLRNDMTVIQGTLDFARNTIEDPELTERIDTAIEKCRELTKTSDQTRKLNEIIETAQAGRTTPTDIVPLIEAVVADYRSEYPNATITTDCPDTAPVEAGERVRWALDNLVENAIVHAESDPEVQITVADETTAEDGQPSDWVTVTVADKGPGIPAGEVAVLDDETNRTTTTHGSGLGLWIVKQIADAYNGQLAIERNPETAFSTVVTLRLQPKATGETELLTDTDAE